MKSFLPLSQKLLVAGISLDLNFENFDLRSEKVLMEGMAQKIYWKKKND